MFGMWEGKVAAALLRGLTILTILKGAEVIGWCNELWDNETGTKQADKIVDWKGS